MKATSRSWTTTDRRLVIGTIVGSWLILACTAASMPIVWDEGNYLWRGDQIVAWFTLLFDVANPQGGLHALSSAVIDEHWQFTKWQEGHPAWFAIPIAAGKGLLSSTLSPLTAARIGPITVFSIALGAVALRLGREYGLTAAIVAPIALLSFPRVFSHAHVATLDGQLTGWWLLLWVADSSRQRGTRTMLAVGVLLGLTCATKFTGWVALLPLVITRAVARDGKASELLVILPAAVVTFVAVNPPLWHGTLTGLAEHVRLNLSRSEAWNVPIVFLGQRYDMHSTLPWYNTVAWLILVTPLPTLVLGAVGLRCAIFQRPPAEQPRAVAFGWHVPFANWSTESRCFGVLVHWATLMVVRALPGAPPHDGIRLFLPAFGFWCIFAAIGAQRVWNATSDAQGGRWRGTLVRSVHATALALTVANLVRYYPQTLSHYSVLVGGVRGAARMGMEPTYWWDALDADVLEWINSHTEPGAAVAFSEISDFNVALLREWGRLQTEVANPQAETFKWYVIQNRPGLLTDTERTLIQSAKPAYRKYAGRHGIHVPPDLNVPLIFIFSYDQYQHATLGNSNGLR